MLLLYIIKKNNQLKYGYENQTENMYDFINHFLFNPMLVGILFGVIILYIVISYSLGSGSNNMENGSNNNLSFESTYSGSNSTTNSSSKMIGILFLIILLVMIVSNAYFYYYNNLDSRNFRFSKK